ncbi:MAG: hypothetical protein ACOY4P_15220 [Pseudomonadota bacterium]
MTVADLLPRLAGVRKTNKGWSARCPAHPDRSPSLSIAEGERGILLHCHAGCDTDAVCAALGLTLTDLCAGERQTSGTRRQHTPRRLTPREWLAAAELGVWRGAIAREYRALAVLDRARGLDVSQWTDADYDAAMAAVARAYDDLRVAEHLHTLSADWRALIQRWDRERRAAA